MSNTFTLFKIMMKQYFSWADKDDKQKTGILFFIIAMIPVTLFWFWFVNGIVSGIHPILAEANLQHLIIAFALLITGLTIILTSIPTIVTSFYFANDLESYLTLPVKAYQILIGKTLAPLITVYGATAVIMVPTLLMYGLTDGAGSVYIIFSLFTFVLFPIIPFILASILVMFLMRFANIAKNKDRTKVFAGIFSFAMVIGINVVIRLNQNPENMSSDFAQWIQKQDDLLWGTSKFLPNVYIATKAIESTYWWQNALFFILLFVVTGLFIALFMWIGQRLYFQGVQGISSGNKGKTFTSLSNKLYVRPVYWSYTLKELRTIYRTPSFFINCIVQNLFAPFFILIIMFFENNLGSITEMVDQFNEKYILLAMFGISLFVMGSNPTATSSISREGYNWFTNKYLPIDPKTIIYSKALAAWIIDWVSIAVLFILFTFLLKVPFLVIALWVVLTALASWFSVFMGIYVDLNNPRLNWSDEQQVFKSRFAPLLTLLIQAFSFGFLILATWNLPFISGLWLTTLTLLLGTGIALYIAHKIAMKTTQKRFHYLG
ncbi:putative ABC transporter permease subunit [Pontibacillus marinus]|uniref:Uncharacterized protein n=1 Tax=Pontibacillus marinus BH030004 = DSM 16465 TaxID=1385511 RepID=A0A0A5HMW5_9BACI|nr:hypothetical protein [Pontibacillus marinus]KGX84952.1 hypothetical protein N783_15700 [Pontibacillus marinus BH030004 = DSM 16465]